ncbi:MAG: DUF3368 domain-containing protein [Bacteroidales bacterium]|nr:DUF3368 domain-containing protein [Bacteroidales bacterium]
MRKIISNTTPILSLLKINKLHLLRELYGKIIIPNAVFQEIEEGKDKLFYKNLALLDWIIIENIKNNKPKEYIFDLDAGEADVLILAKEHNADLVILDEISGRRYAKQLNLNLTGTIGILLKAKEKGLIKSVKELLTELTEKGTWFHPKLILKTLELANEK